MPSPLENWFPVYEVRGRLRPHWAQVQYMVIGDLGGKSTGGEAAHPLFLHRPPKPLTTRTINFNRPQNNYFTRPRYNFRHQKNPLLLKNPNFQPPSYQLASGRRK